MMRTGASNFDDEGDADRTTEMSEAGQGGIRRKRREHDAGASNVTARREHSSPGERTLMETVVARENIWTPIAATGASTLPITNIIMNRRIRNRMYGGVGGR